MSDSDETVCNENINDDSDNGQKSPSILSDWHEQRTISSRVEKHSWEHSPKTAAQFCARGEVRNNDMTNQTTEQSPEFPVTGRGLKRKDSLDENLDASDKFTAGDAGILETDDELRKAEILMEGVEEMVENFENTEGTLENNDDYSICTKHVKSQLETIQKFLVAANRKNQQKRKVVMTDEKNSEELSGTKRLIIVNLAKKQRSLLAAFEKYRNLVQRIKSMRRSSKVLLNEESCESTSNVFQTAESDKTNGNTETAAHIDVRAGVSIGKSNESVNPHIETNVVTSLRGNSGVQSSTSPGLSDPKKSNASLNTHSFGRQESQSLTTKSLSTPQDIDDTEKSRCAHRTNSRQRPQRASQREKTSSQTTAMIPVPIHAASAQSAPIVTPSPSVQDVPQGTSKPTVVIITNSRQLAGRAIVQNPLSLQNQPTNTSKRILNSRQHNNRQSQLQPMLLPMVQNHSNLSSANVTQNSRQPNVTQGASQLVSLQNITTATSSIQNPARMTSSQDLTQSWPSQGVNLVLTKKTEGSTLSLEKLIKTGVLVPGKDVLTAKSEGKLYFASLSDKGSITSTGGEVFSSPRSWLKAILGSRRKLKNEVAWKMISCKNKSLLDHASELPPGSTEMTGNKSAAATDEKFAQTKSSVRRPQDELINSWDALKSLLNDCRVLGIAKEEILSSAEWWKEDF